MKFLTYFTTLLKIFPLVRQIADALNTSVGTILSTVIASMHLLQNTMPEAGRGAERLQALKDMIAHAYDVTGKTLDSFEANWPLIEGAIGGIVTVFQAAGVFKKLSGGDTASPTPSLTPPIASTATA